MAPPVRHASPIQQLVELAAVARADGLGFDEMWRCGLRPGRSLVLTTTRKPPAGAVRFPTDATERRSWLTALEATREGWRRAYEGAAATGPEAALALLGPLLDEFDRERRPVSQPVAVQDVTFSANDSDTRIG